jgi:hypothetical protein
MKKARIDERTVERYYRIVLALRCAVVAGLTREAAADTESSPRDGRRV